MSEKKYIVPEGMLKSMDDALNADNKYLDWSGPSDCERLPIVACEAAIRWLAENPEQTVQVVQNLFKQSMPNWDFKVELVPPLPPSITELQELSAKVKKHPDIIRYVDTD